MTTSKVPEDLFGNMDGFKDFEFSAPEGDPVPPVVKRLYRKINDEVYRGELPDASEGLVVNRELDDMGASASFVRRDGLDQFWLEFSEERKIFELPSSLVHEMAHLLNHLAQWKDIEAGKDLEGHDDGFKKIAEAVGLPINDLSSWPDPQNREYLEWAAGLLEDVRDRTEVAQKIIEGRRSMEEVAQRILSGESPESVLEAELGTFGINVDGRSEIPESLILGGDWKAVWERLNPVDAEVLESVIKAGESPVVDLQVHLMGIDGYEDESELSEAIAEFRSIQVQSLSGNEAILTQKE